MMKLIQLRDLLDWWAWWVGGKSVTTRISYSSKLVSSLLVVKSEVRPVIPICSVT